MKRLFEFVALILVLSALPHAMVAVATGCAALGPRVAGAADTAAYERELDDCLKEARDAGRVLAVYDQCAREADIRHGVKDGGAR